MNLLEFRQFFRNSSGRYDLVTSTGADNGLGVFLNAGQKYLDGLVDIPSAIGRVFRNLTASEYMVMFRDCRSISEVWCQGAASDGTVTRRRLEKHSLSELRGTDGKWLEDAYVQLPSDIENGRPLYYSPAQLRMIPNVDGEEGGIGEFMEVLADGHQYFNGVVVMPPADGNYSIEVVGNFYSQTFTSDTDSTYWSEQHPMLLYMSVMRQLELVHRNSEGVRDWDAGIMQGVVALDMDGVAQECAEIVRMEG